MSKVAKLHPEEMEHRTGQLAVDLALTIANLIDFASKFLSKRELFHLQMNILYILIDIMQATSKASVDNVLNEIRDYFKKLERDKNGG